MMLKPGRLRRKEDRIIQSVVNNLFSVSLISLMTVLVGTILDGLIISNYLSVTDFAAFGLSAPLTNLIELMGNVVATGCVVAWSTVNGLSAFISALPKAFGQSTLIGSGVFYGEEDKDSLARFFRYTYVPRTVVTGIAVIGICIFSPLLIRLYLPPASDAYADAVSGLRWYALGLLPYTINIIASSYLQSIKRPVAAQIINFMDGFGMLVLWALFLLNVIGFRGLCMSFFFGKATVLPGTLAWIASVRKSVRPSIPNLLMLPEDFDVPDSDKFLATVTGRENAVNISEKIISYCGSKGIDRKRSNHVGLALEEMSVIIVDSGFHDGRNHSIDIKLFVKDGQITIRLRDDCKAFDATRRDAIMHPEDNCSNVGIRILNSIAKDISYYSTLDMNYLTMHV